MYFIKIIIVGIIIIFFTNCKGDGNANHQNLAQQFSLNNYPHTENLTQEIKNALAYMGNEERLAYDVYTNLYNYHAKYSGIWIKQLQNISQKSEILHISIVQSLVQRYNLNENNLTNVITPIADNTIEFINMPSGEYDILQIQELYNTLYSLGQQSYEDALKVGCMVEVTDINDLDNYISQAQEINATDILEAFKILREGSYKHYWAFDKGLKRQGLDDGCYFIDDNLLTNKNNIYPKN